MSQDATVEHTLNLLGNRGVACELDKEDGKFVGALAIANC
jgi:hypothetical protein